MLLMSLMFVKHFELPCVERCYINKLALPISRGLLLECWGVEVRGYIGFGGGEGSEVVSFAHGSDRVSCLLATCHCETLI